MIRKWTTWNRGILKTSPILRKDIRWVVSRPQFNQTWNRPRMVSNSGSQHALTHSTFLNDDLPAADCESPQQVCLKHLKHRWNSSFSMPIALLGECCTYVDFCTLIAIYPQGLFANHSMHHRSNLVC